MTDFYQPLSLYNICLRNIQNEPFIEKFYLNQFFNKNQLDEIISHFKSKKYVYNVNPTYSIIPVVHTLVFGYIDIGVLRSRYVIPKKRLRSLKDFCLETIYKNNLDLFNGNTNLPWSVKKDLNLHLNNRKDEVFNQREKRSSLTISKRKLDEIKTSSKTKNLIMIREFISIDNGLLSHMQPDIVYEIPLIIKLQVKVIDVDKKNKILCCSSPRLSNLSCLENYFCNNYMCLYKGFKFSSSVKTTHCKSIKVNYELFKLDNLSSYKYIHEECLKGDQFNVWLRISYNAVDKNIKFIYDLELIESINEQYDFNFTFDDF